MYLQIIVLKGQATSNKMLIVEDLKIDNTEIWDLFKHDREHDGTKEFKNLLVILHIPLLARLDIL